MEPQTVSSEHGTASQLYAANMIDANDAINKFIQASSDFKKVEEAETDTILSVSKSLLGFPELRDDSRVVLVNRLKDLSTSRDTESLYGLWQLVHVNMLSFTEWIFKMRQKIDYTKFSVYALDRANATVFRLAEEHYSSLTRIASRKASLVTQATTILDHENDPSWKAAAGIDYQLGKLRNWPNTKEQLNKFIAEMKLQCDRLLRCWLDIQSLLESAGEDGFDLDASTTAVRDRLNLEMLLVY